MKPTPPGWPRISSGIWYEDPRAAIDDINPHAITDNTQGIIAAAPQQGISAFARNQRIGPGPAFQNVIPRTAIQHVVRALPGSIVDRNSKALGFRAGMSATIRVAICYPRRDAKVEISRSRGNDQLY